MLLLFLADVFTWIFCLICQKFIVMIFLLSALIGDMCVFVQFQGIHLDLIASGLLTMCRGIIFIN